MADTDHLASRVKAAGAKPPKVPKEYEKRFISTTYDTFYNYIEARAYHDWTIPDLRLVAQIALMEDMIFRCLDEIINGDIIVTGSTGNTVANPATNVMLKIQMQQGALLRRLGVSIDGFAKPSETKNKGKAQNDLNRAFGGTPSAKGASNLLA